MRTYLAIGGGEIIDSKGNKKIQTEFDNTYKKALIVYEEQEQSYEMFQKQKNANVLKLQEELNAERKITEEKITQNQQTQDSIKLDIQQTKERQSKTLSEEQQTKEIKKQLAFRKEIRDFEKGMSAKQKNASFAVDALTVSEAPILDEVSDHFAVTDSI